MEHIHEKTDRAFASPEEEISFIRRPRVRRTIYAGLILFAVLMVLWPFIAQLLDPRFEKHIAEHRVIVGMTKEQVLQSWGGPQTINTTFTDDGIRREEWIFEDWESTSTVKHRYLYFEEGKLVGGWFQGSGERLPPMAPPNPHTTKPSS